MYGLEPKLGVSSSNTTTNPRDIKAILDFSKKQNESVGALPKIKVDLPRPKRVSILFFFFLTFYYFNILIGPEFQQRLFRNKSNT